MVTQAVDWHHKAAIASVVLGAVMSTKGPKLQSIWEKKVDAPVVLSCRKNVERQPTRCPWQGVFIWVP